MSGNIPADQVSNGQSGQTTSNENQTAVVNQGPQTQPQLNIPKVEKQALSQKALDVLNANEAARKEAEKESQYFSLNIGDETIINVFPERTTSFKTKTQDGRLVTQFRYFLYDMSSDSNKQWDVFHNVSHDIDERIKQGICTMKVVGVANTRGKIKYEIHDLNS